jgi:hypothetical protein
MRQGDAGCRRRCDAAGQAGGHDLHTDAVPVGQHGKVDASRFTPARMTMLANIAVDIPRALRSCLNGSAGASAGRATRAILGSAIATGYEAATSATTATLAVEMGDCSCSCVQKLECQAHDG